MVIEGKNISNAVRMVQEMKEGEYETDIADDEEVMDETPNINSETVTKLRNRIKIQENQIKNLKNRNNTLDSRMKGYEMEVAKLKEKIVKLQYEYTQNILLDKELHSKTSLIKKLEDKYNQEKALRTKLEENLHSLENIQRIKPTENALPVKIIESFTRMELWPLRILEDKKRRCGASGSSKEADHKPLPC